MKPEPLPGARCTVSESRRGGATQGHAHNSRYCAPRLDPATSPHSCPVTSSRSIGRAEAIMVSNWAGIESGHAHALPTPSGHLRSRRCSLYLAGVPFRSSCKHWAATTPDRLRRGYSSRRNSQIPLDQGYCYATSSEFSATSRLPRSISIASSTGIEGRGLGDIWNAIGFYRKAWVTL